ncbi:MAG: class I SAM-dependent methyltransferase [Promethearchaeota archaeon]
MNHKKSIKFLYDETTEGYDRRYNEIQKIKYKIIFEQISIEPGQKILDIGCGTGNLFLFLENIDCLKYGIDLSSKSLKRCQEKLGKEKLIHVICADIDFPPFKKDFFEKIFLVTILQNVPDPARSLKEIKNLCKQNGYVILSLLKKKFSMEQIKTLLEDIQVVPQQIIDMDDCEDIIIIVKII